MTVIKHYIYMKQTRDDNDKIQNSHMLFIKTVPDDNADQVQWNLPTEADIPDYFCFDEGCKLQKIHQVIIDNQFIVARIVDETKHIEHQFIVRMTTGDLAALVLDENTSGLTIGTIADFHVAQHDSVISQVLSHIVDHDFLQRPRYLEAEISTSQIQAPINFVDRALHALHHTLPGVLNIEFNGQAPHIMVMTFNNEDRSRAACQLLNRLNVQGEKANNDFNYDEDEVMGNPVIKVHQQLIGLLFAKLANEFHKFNQTKKAWRCSLSSSAESSLLGSAPPSSHRRNGVHKRVHFAVSEGQKPLSRSSDAVALINAANQEEKAEDRRETQSTGPEIKASSSPLPFDHLPLQTTKKDDDEGLMFEMEFN